MPDTNPDFFLDNFQHPVLPPDLAYTIHLTAVLEAGVTVGRGSAIWDHVHIRRDTVIGDECVVGEKTYVAYGVKIGHRCKVNSFVYICTAVTLEDGVMVSAGTVFTNDRFPRATTPDLLRLRPSEPDEQTLPTLVREGATIGANCTIGNGLTVGRFAMIGMGAVVTQSVPDFALVVGNPARQVGCVCRCGQVTARFRASGPVPDQRLKCPTCDRRYALSAGRVTELGTVDQTPPVREAARG